MRQFIQNIWIFIAILCSSISAFAYDFEVDGIYYKITSMADLEVEVTHRYDKAPDYNSSYTGEVIIPSSVNYNNRTYSVVSIGYQAFGGGGYNYPGCDITKVSLPETIECIGIKSFYRCQYLTSIQLPSKLKTIEDDAFYSAALELINIPNSVIEIGYKAFYATSLSKVILGSNLTTIEESAFANCKNLLEVFCTAEKKPEGLSTSTFNKGHSAMEIYVPSVKEYGFGREYISFTNDRFTYNGQPHNIEWVNNLKAYKCEIQESELKTESNAGEYIQNVIVTYSDGLDLTLSIPYEYTIDKAPLTFTVLDCQKEYGDPNPAFSCNITGFVNGENEESIGNTPSFECEATQLSNIGTYPIRASLDAPNYEITYKYGNLTILKAPLTCSIENTSRKYGDENPDFKLTYSGLKLNQTNPDWIISPTFNTPANKKSNVGEYVVEGKGGETLNYNVTALNPGVLNVIKRDLTVKANDCERLYGENNPNLDMSFIGFVNDDTKKDFSSQPIAECAATKESDAGKYPITVSGGNSMNYNFVYQDGVLSVLPLTVGFKDVYNTVTYNDMGISTTGDYFNYIPEIIGPFSSEDFDIELWFIDKDNKYTNHVQTITSGDYAGNYVYTNLDRPMWAGKYIFNIVSKGNNVNVVANPARAYLTVNRASNNLEWDDPSTISVNVGEKIELGISYQADIFCDIHTDFNKELIELSSTGAQSESPTWYVTGVKEGETTLYFNITSQKNDLGFYDFSDSQQLSKKIKVLPGSGVNIIDDSNETVRIIVRNQTLHINNMSEDTTVKVFSLQGNKILETTETTIESLSKGIYLIVIGNKTFKVSL